MINVSGCVEILPKSDHGATVDVCLEAKCENTAYMLIHDTVVQSHKIVFYQPFCAGSNP